MSYDNPRISSLGMTTMDVVMSLGEGNMGATRVLFDLLANAPKIDPDSALGGLGPMCSLDNLDCYGPRIWSLYKNVCGGNLRHMMAVLRANQMGFVSEAPLRRAIDGDKAAVDVASLVAQVKDALPAFQAEAPDAVNTERAP